MYRESETYLTSLACSLTQTLLIEITNARSLVTTFSLSSCRARSFAILTGIGHLMCNQSPNWRRQSFRQQSYLFRHNPLDRLQLLHRFSRMQQLAPRLL